MAMLRRALIRFQQNPTLAAAVSPLRPQYGLLSRLSTHVGSYDFDLSNEEIKRRLFNRLVYRSKQRGFLELDLVLGNWVEENIRSLDEPHIKALMDVLDLENPDLWKWLTGQEQRPDAVKNNPMVPLDKLPTGITRPLVEILRDLNKRVPDNIISRDQTSIPWYHANRMLSFYAPGWCGEVRDVKYSDNGSVSVVYRVTIRGTDGEAHREATGTVALNDGRYEDAVAAAEEAAFCKACARFGFGLYLYHED